MLQRWSAVFPQSRMVDEIKDLPMAEQQILRDQDPELFALLSNTAPAELELAAMTGALAEQVASPEERQNAAIAQEIQQLVDSNPWGSQGTYVPDPSHPMGQRYVAGAKENLTAQHRLMMLAPEKALVMQEAAKPPVAGGLSQEQCDQINAQAASLHIQRAV